jgi:hypothetical protein
VVVAHGQAQDRMAGVNAFAFDAEIAVEGHVLLHDAEHFFGA